jgi:hypothetical protein
MRNVTILIKEPIWKDLSIGIGKKHLAADTETVLIQIAYRGADGKRKWPKPWAVTKEWVEKYPLKKFGKGTEVYCIPIADLELLEA